jgi:copper chaperone CopZ
MRLRSSLTTVTVLLAACMLAACSEQPQSNVDNVSVKAPAKSSELRFDVKGMHCGGCADAIAATLQNLDGVISCQATFESQEKSSAVVTVADASMAASVEKTINDLGYETTPAGGS